MRSRATILAVLVFCSAGRVDLVHASDAQNYLEPTDWSVGDPNSTYQEWDLFSLMTGSAPDLGWIANPAINDAPTFSGLSPGFLTGSGNFYSFSGDYGFFSDITNHGGSSGAGAYSSQFGTHVVVQTSSSMNGEDSVYQDSLEIVDFSGAPIVGGDNASALEITEIFRGLVDSSFGEVTLQELRYEFWLPGYTDDFRVQADIIVHSSFMQFRVDSLVREAVRGDMNGDLRVDAEDIPLFILALTDRGAYESLHPNTDLDFVGDFDGNEKLDLGDVQSFKAAVSGSAPANATRGVPEPSVSSLLLMGLVAGFCSPHRRTRNGIEAPRRPKIS